jgi:flagellar hook-associated protein 3 FlgL
MMSGFRITQRLMTQHSLTSMQSNLNRLSASQDRLSSGRAINRPSDSPTGTNDAMRLRAALAAGDQHVANAQDGSSWLDHADATLSSMVDSVHRVRELMVQGASTGSNGPAARTSIANELTEIRKGLIQSANTQHLGRPLFGGTTAGTTAYDENGAFVGDTNPVNRTIGEGISVAVNVAGPDAFSTGNDDLFTMISDAVDALANDPDALSGMLDRADAVTEKLTSALSSVGTRTVQVEGALNALTSSTLNNKTSLSNVENVDIAQAIMDVQFQTVSYQAALGATAKVIQPSLLDFLR